MLIEVFVSLAWRYGLVAVFIYAARLWAAGYRFRGGVRGERERDVRNRTFLLVGSLSSTSLEVFEHLAGKGAVVIALHPDPGDPVVVQLLLLLRSITRNEQLYVEKCDVTSVASISAFVEGWSQNARRGMVNDLEVVIDTIVFSDDDYVSSLRPTYINYNGVTVEATHAANLTSRLVFLNKFMPILKRSSELNSIHPIRIINVVNALYSLGSPRSGTIDADYRKTKYPTLQPWLADARAALYSAAVFHQLQIKDMIVISVSPGFTRKYWRTLFVHKWKPYAFFPLKHCGLAMYIVLLPFIWLLTKSSAEASQGILHSIYTPIARHTHSALNPQKDPALPEKLVPGGLYREGRLVPLGSFIPDAAKLSLYEAEMDTVSSIVNRK